MSFIDGGVLSEDPRQYILNLVLQPSNLFDFTVIANPLDNITKGAGIGGAASLGAQIINTVSSTLDLKNDLEMFKFRAQDLAFPYSINFETSAVDRFTYPSAIIYPEALTVKFLESDDGKTIRYLQSWKNRVAIPEETKNSGGLTEVLNAAVGGPSIGYVWQDNQKAAEKTGMLLIKNAQNQFNLRKGYPRIMFYGLKIKSIGDAAFSQSSEDYITYDVVFSVRQIKIPLLF